ncbi:putative late blight resistance protein homolog R1A-3 [Coffea eugenioides]|uniref:putative late blight resistance protein homolog R1A-3 n=1 Tax=Coffea eugenioides TaxID=49369 RepID=UPI000F60E97E|nr:putative late blight resistance protein homolog R1A-3 [Coffea eugenioides]XP_027178496.1 putative late blight resistance protein homolog R1A-3 [Coffea eugenioides]XP_027178497.1 putative late blight resistance protein homolog R1A-3 [Coffea eugenioides]
MSQGLGRGIICFRIQDVTIRMVHDLQSAYLLYNHSDESDFDILESALTRSRENIMLLLEADIKKSCTIIFFDYYSPGDPRLVMDLIVSFLETMEDPLEVHFNHKREKLMDTIRQKLMLLRNLIGIATMRGVESMQLTDLLTHVAIVVAHLISICRFDGLDEQVFNQMESEISRLIHEKINPLDAQVRETYIHVMTASKKQSRSSYALALEENEHPVLVEFVNSLLYYLMDLLESCGSFQVPVKDQMLKLHRGVRCLRFLLKQELKLGDEINDLTGVMVCDAGILIFSLSINEIKEGLPEETDLGLFHFHKVLKYMMAEAAHNYPLTSPYSSSNYPRSNELGCMDFFLENLKELARCDEADDSIVSLLDRIQMVEKDLIFLRSFLENVKEQSDQNGKLQALRSQVMEAAYKAELLIYSTLVGDKCEHSLDAVARDINLLKIEALEIHNGQTQRVNNTSSHIPSQHTAAIHNEDLVGLDDALQAITHRLTRGSRQLDVVPIVGMPGLGKTTLANKVYNSPSVRSHFHVRGWCCVSQTFSTHSLLTQLLCSISSESPDKYLKMDANDLAMKLRQVLLRTRYLLVLDDLWDVETWNLLKISLPNDGNGSRILLTSRLHSLSLQIKPDNERYHLRQLNDVESWTLLQKKLFDKEGCPPTLSEVGSQIAKCCGGLPLTIVLVAGILATITQDSWEEVAESLSSTVLYDEYCMKILELSYRHLPEYLKACLLYFSAFQEDEVINVQRLLWLWISEGFVQQTEGKSLEEVAYDCLLALINRSLVMVTKKRTTNGAKTCQLHDVVHEFCVKKAKEESFLHIIHSWKDPFSLTGPSYHHRVCVHYTSELKIWELMLIFPNLHSLFLFGPYHHVPKEENLGILFPKLLRVLDLGDLNFRGSFPMAVLLLVRLRYLALSGITSIPSAIANLSRLEALIVEKTSTDIVLPNTIWNIKTLSYLRTTKGAIVGFIFPITNLEVSPDLDHLETLSLAIDPSSQSLQKILTKLPSIRRLKCKRSYGLGEATRNCDKILVFDCLNQLQSLRLTAFDGYGFKFPLNLKKLTLKWNRQPWSEISTIGKLPNLEVLKLLKESFVGEEWVMEEGEFPSLRVLELSMLDVRNWSASSDNFSRLEKLCVHSCMYLEEVPSCLGECETLEMIEVKGCRESVADSVKQILQEQMDMGNEVLKTVIEDFGYTFASPEVESIPSVAESIPSVAESNFSEEESNASEQESISSHHA